MKISASSNTPRVGFETHGLARGGNGLGGIATHDICASEDALRLEALRILLQRLIGEVLGPLRIERVQRQLPSSASVTGEGFSDSRRRSSPPAPRKRPHASSNSCQRGAAGDSCVLPAWASRERIRTIAARASGT